MKRTPTSKRDMKARAIRKTFTAHERAEVERIIAMLKRRPALSLQKLEVQTLLRYIDDKQKKVPRGAPSVLAAPHRFMAIHFWWLRESKTRNAAKRVGRMWGVSGKAVEKYARAYKSAAIEYIREARVKTAANPELNPATVLDSQLELLAAGFRDFG